MATEKKNSKFTVKSRIASFKYALKGIYYFFSGEINAKIHLAAAATVVILGFIFNLSSTEWFCIIILIALVLMAEAFNTAIEKLTDLVSPQHHPEAGKIKDIAAGAVLITSIAALLIGLFIFGRHILLLL